MDVDTAIALATAAAGGAANGAGGTAWESLVSLFRRATGRSAPDADTDTGDDTADTADGVADDTATAPTPEAASEDPRVLVARIEDRARADEDFAAALRQWAQEHQGALQTTTNRDTVHNTVAHGAQISGTVIQARDIQGNITL
ncbi:hypothetical protein ACTWP5_24365 [Streptomyces sp. 4N509B]|uniref:hypothetical protein n=1 Tax=Streptomyces sp. 4N509B TaxID=3457413 RepID=UPI003FD1077B